MNKTSGFFALLFFTSSLSALAGHHEHGDAHHGHNAKKGVEAYIISPKNGETVTSPITVVFGLKGMGIAPAGIEKKHTGHHHLLIDTDIPSANEPIPADDNHRHFGKGQTETSLELSPGEHTLQLLIGNHSHMQHAEPVVSEKITITVE
ncbi:MAG: rod shape-determining protein RodA [Gammaproteobacteria bacterium]|nr:DUF4399 domain-containing protein [Gammaproteobacteria bacterium]PCH64445.1 MAG: rod shape-determining protein RodA [Gammaproteobacteria bacterium]